MRGFSSSIFHCTAPRMHASTQAPQPTHRSGLSLTPPVGLTVRASTGHALAQGGSLQALQTITLKPLDIPPADTTLIAVFASPALPDLLEQANIQLWQPTHLCESLIRNLIFPPQKSKNDKTEYYNINS